MRKTAKKLLMKIFPYRVYTLDEVISSYENFIELNEEKSDKMEE
jgi:hypothetical protein